MSAPERRPLCVQLLPDTEDAGAENQCRYLLEGLRDCADFDVELAYFSAGRAHEAFTDLGVPMMHVARRGRFRTDAYGRARRIRRAYASRQPDLLHTWMPEANVIGMLAARRWPATKVVISQRGSWNELDYPGIIRLQRLLLGRADHAISNSPGGAEMLAHLGMRADRITVIANGIPAERVRIDADREATRERLGWTGREVVAWVGRATDPATAGQKDLGTLFAGFEALAERLPGALLALIGPTPQELAERGLTPPAGTQVLGWQARPSELLDAADLLMLSSRQEGNSNVVGEALLLGLPVVSTDCGGHCPAVLAAGGRVVPVGDHEGLATAAEALLRDPPPRESVRNAAERELSVDRMVSEHVALYRELAGINATSPG